MRLKSDLNFFSVQVWNSVRVWLDPEFIFWLLQPILFVIWQCLESPGANQDTLTQDFLQTHNKTKRDSVFMFHYIPQSAILAGSESQQDLFTCYKLSFPLLAFLADDI